MVPSSPDWIHEVKHDGFRLIVVRDGDRVRLLTRNGLPLYQHVADAIPSKSICPDRETRLRRCL